METQRFIRVLDRLHEIQKKAAIGGCRSFDVAAYFWESDHSCGDEPDELAIEVSIHKDSACYQFGFFESASQSAWDEHLADIEMLFEEA